MSPLSESTQRLRPAGRAANTDGRTDGLTEKSVSQVDIVTLADACARVWDEINFAGERLNSGPRCERASIPPLLRRLVYERDNRTCQWCGSRERLTLDHVIPIAARGADVSRNLRTLCWPCNEQRSNFRTDVALAEPLGVVEFCTPCLPHLEGRPVRERVAVFCGMCGLTSWTDCSEDIL